MQEQFKTYLYEHNFITDDQSAYRSNHSTETSLHKVIIDVLEGINDGLLTGITLFDLAKCFDTIDHDILMLKLEKYGVKSNVLSWFKSYLSDRTQLVKCDAVFLNHSL